MQKKLTASLAIALITTAFGANAFAQQAAVPAAAPAEATAEAAALDAVTVNLADAIAAVEAKKTGKVVEAALVTAGATSVYQITTLRADGTETNYAVDAKTGAVVTTLDQGQDNGNDDDGGYEGHDQGEHGERADGQNEGPNGDGDGETQDDVAN